MAILKRILKREYEGFRDFVKSIETTTPDKRREILLTATLEDPVFMNWVIKNVMSTQDLLSLPEHELVEVLNYLPTGYQVLAKAIKGMPELGGKIETFSNGVKGRIKDDLEYLKDITPEMAQSALFVLIKTSRILQAEDRILGKAWRLPEIGIFRERVMPQEGEYQFIDEDGVIRAEGAISKMKRNGPWKFYYGDQSLMALGQYEKGFKDGPWTFYYSNGKVMLEGKFMEDRKFDTWFSYDIQGAKTEKKFDL